MPAFDEAFNAAYNTQLRANQLAAERKEREERAAWEREDRAYRDSERKRIGDARSALENTIAGMDTSSQRDIGALGYTPDQIATGIAAQGGARAFADQVARYQNDFDSSDLATGGAGERAAAGLPLQGSKVNPAAVRAPRKSELARARAKYALAMGQDPGAALADQDAAVTQERMRDWFGQFSHLSNEGLMKHPMLRGMLNDNGAVRGAVGLSPDGKNFVVADYDGSGKAEYLSRDELMQAAYQKFLESEGRVPESIALGVGRSDRRRARNREDVRDTNEGRKLAFDMNTGNRKLGLAEQELADNRDFRSQSLGLQREGVNLRRTELDRTHPTMSQADREALMNIERTWYSETDPAKKQALERQYQMVTSRAALNMGKVLGLPGARSAADVKVHDGGIIQRGGQLFSPGPDGKYSELRLGPSALDQALAADRGAPAGGLDPGPKGLVPFGRDDLNPPDTSRMQRVAERGMLGGISYVYRDPVTGKTYSTQEYNSLIDRGY